MGVDVGISVGIMVSSTTTVVGVDDGNIWVGSGVKVSMIVGVAMGVTRVAVGVGGESNNLDAWIGIENSTCNRGAPAESPSNDFAARLPFLPPVMIITMEFPEFQLGWLTIS